MAFDKKTWVNRQSEFPTRRTLIPVNGEENVYDVTRNEGTITTEGDAFNAANMNDLEERINEGLENIDTVHLTDIELTITKDENGDTLASPIVFSIVAAIETTVETTVAE